MTVAVIVLASILFAIGYLGVAAFTAYLLGRDTVKRFGAFDADDIGAFEALIALFWPVSIWFPLLSAIEFDRVFGYIWPLRWLMALGKLGAAHEDPEREKQRQDRAARFR